jgi:anthranilate synthase component 2
VVILIDNYDSFTWNLVHYLGEIGAETVVHRNDKVSVGQVLSARPEAIVLSPGPCTPNEAGICLALITEASASSVPVLGVCLGHQAIGQAFGGKVVRAPKVMHGKMSAIDHTREGVFKDVPDHFQATRYHSLIVDRQSLPACLKVTAETDGIIMGLEHKERPVHGVQFHPESIASEHGHKILHNFLSLAGAVDVESASRSLCFPRP